jgi:hypothetical protein
MERLKDLNDFETDIYVEDFMELDTYKCKHVCQSDKL